MRNRARGSLHTAPKKLLHGPSKRLAAGLSSRKELYCYMAPKSSSYTALKAFELICGADVKSAHSKTNLPTTSAASRSAPPAKPATKYRERHATPATHHEERLKFAKEGRPQNCQASPAEQRRNGCGGKAQVLPAARLEARQLTQPTFLSFSKSTVYQYYM